MESRGQAGDKGHIFATLEQKKYGTLNQPQLVIN